jgi:hypothetical protein
VIFTNSTKEIHEKMLKDSLPLFMKKKVYPRAVHHLLRRMFRASNSVAKRFGTEILISGPSNFSGPGSSRKFSFAKLTKSHAIMEMLLKLRPISTQYSLVRIGDSGDGGYLVPDDLANVGACFSAGCDLKWSFERDLYQKYKIISNIIDEESKRPADLPSNFSYTPAFLGIKNLPGTKKFSDWVNSFNISHNDNFILQMDIEGAEWESILEIPDNILMKFSILVIEFHNTASFRIAKYFDNTYRPVLEKILTNYEPVHIHGNNSCGIDRFGNFEFPHVFEMTFLRKDRIVSSTGYCELPNPLDSKNVQDRDEIIFHW